MACRTLCFVSSATLEVPTERGGGIQEALWEVATRLPRNLNVHVIAPRSWVKPRTPNCKEGLNGSVIVHGVSPRAMSRYPPDEKVSWDGDGVRRVLRLLFYGVSATIKLAQVHSRHPLSIVVAWEKFSSLLVIPFCTLILRVPVVLSESSIWPWVYPEPSGSLARTRHRIGVWVMRRLTRLVARVHANSESIREGMGRCNIPREKVTVIPNGVDLSAFPDTRDKPGSFTAGYIGRLVPERGADLLAASVRRVLEERSSVKFVIGGDGPLRHVVQQLPAEDVQFKGQVPRDMVPGFLQGISAALFLSPRENVPSLALLEAMASGRAIVATNVGDTPALLRDGTDGILVSPNPEAVAAALRELADNPEAVDRLGRGARRSAKAFDWDRIASEHLTLYQRILASRGMSV